jgi:hypothetical protein
VFQTIYDGYHPLSRILPSKTRVQPFYLKAVFPSSTKGYFCKTGLLPLVIYFGDI